MQNICERLPVFHGINDFVVHFLMYQYSERQVSFCLYADNKIHFQEMLCFLALLSLFVVPVL